MDAQRDRLQVELKDWLGRPAAVAAELRAVELGPGAPQYDQIELAAHGWGSRSTEPFSKSGRGKPRRATWRMQPVRTARGSAAWRQSCGRNTRGTSTTLWSRAQGILAYDDDPICTGPIEGANNEIKTTQRRACGFRDRECLKLKIYGNHEAKYALGG